MGRHSKPTSGDSEVAKHQTEATVSADADAATSAEQAHAVSGTDRGSLEVDSSAQIAELTVQVEKLNAQLQEKNRESAELKDKYLRALAETENTRKRMRQQAEENVRLEREQLLRELLAIIDNLERAVDAARGGGNGKPLVEGVELVLRSMQDFLRNHGVTQIDAVGRPFDPLLHEAVDHVESEDHEPNTVISEFHRGYQIGDRLLRPARVSVSKAPEREGGSGTNGSTPTDVEKP